jgi:UDP-N-acetylglucosamine--N-acetylmuramyl-(pentapeptide) pyrophosphoryl-undecaprenol N-acetylglucosamine transferase
MAVAGHHIPSLLYVPDIEPGLAIKFLARFASCIGLTSDSSRQFFSNKNHCTVTGYPTRPDLKRIDKQSARTEFNLQPDLPVLLVFGGSKGARSINRALFAILEPLLKTTQVLHISGERDWQEVEKAKIELSSTAASHYHAYAYLHEEMGAALACADLVVSRAGASTLGEFPLYGLPAILVPYPHAWRYQRVNATYLADHNAAMIIEDNQLGDQLLPAIKDLLQQPEKLSAMSQAMFSLAHPQAASKLAAIIRDISNQDVHLTGAIQ